MKTYTKFLVTFLTMSVIAVNGCAPSSTLTLAPPKATAVPPTPIPISEQQAIDIVWQALDPNTSSHNQAAWEIIDVQTVTGREVQDQFEGEPVPGGCARGPTPPDNSTIALDGSYWYLQMRPRYATPRPPAELSPTSPPNVPEPFVYQAHFLVDSITGQVVARKLHCVIY